LNTFKNMPGGAGLTPLIDKDGLLKPAILILLEQLIEAGIEEICLVVGSEDDVRVYQDFFRAPLDAEHNKKLPVNMQDYEQTLNEIGEKISYRIQHERRGFGHAVYQCHDFAGGEPVLLLLGDTVYTSAKKHNCSRQLINIYEELEKPLIAIHKIPADQTNHYGILCGSWIDTTRTKMDVTAFVEKPERSYAKKNLSMSIKEDQEEYYAVFGQYILPPQIFTVLKNNIDNQKCESKEIEMTDAFNAFIGNGLTGVVLDGKMYDIGIPPAYQAAFNSFNYRIST